MAGNYYDSIFKTEKDQKQIERQESRNKKREEIQRKQEKRESFFLGAKRMSSALIIIVVVLVIVAALLGKAVYRIMDLQKEKEAAQVQLDELTRKISEMEYELTRVTSDEYIEQQARMKLRMIRPGETLYVIE